MQDGWHDNMRPPMVNTHKLYNSTHNLLWNHKVEPYRRYCREDVWDSDDRRITLCDDCKGRVDALIVTRVHAMRGGGGRGGGGKKEVGE